VGDAHIDGRKVAALVSSLNGGSRGAGGHDEVECGFTDDVVISSIGLSCQHSKIRPVSSSRGRGVLCLNGKEREKSQRLSKLTFYPQLRS
jgi:hypothetical protein